MIFRRFVLICITGALSLPASAQVARENSFRNTLNDVVRKLAARDSAGLSKYIDQKTGVYILNKIGVQPWYHRFPAIGFKDSVYPKAPYYDGIKTTTLIYSRVPDFDCTTHKWSKTGTFVDTSNIDHLLTMTALEMKRNGHGSLSQEELTTMTTLESISRRVVISAAGGKDLVIYLSYINNKWLLTIIDKLTADCSV